MGESMIQTETMGTKSRDVGELSLCPECGAVMDEVDRAAEGQFVYIWLECSKDDCDGSWLRKTFNNPLVGV
ncbi:MAG: hypothetical protein P8Z79_01780 [Sedimentisphaerales bacterium]